MSLKTPTFWRFSAKFGPFLLLEGKLSVSASHRFFASENFSISVRTAVRTTFFPKTENFSESFKVSLRPTLPTHITIYHDEEDHLLLQYHRGSGHTYCWPRPQGPLTDKFAAPKSSESSERLSGRIKRAKNQRSNEYAAASVLERGNS